MKEYLSIGRKIRYGEKTYIFDKLDGSNIRAEWDSKKYFIKFGSRTRLIGTDQEFLPESIDLIKNNFEKEITDILKKQKVDNATLFFEFYGLNSFAGHHIKEKHMVSLFDVNIYKHGFLVPKEFIKYFGNLNIAKLLYVGNMNKIIENSIIENTLEGITFEGVVCKQNPLKNGFPPNMFKIKTNNWINKLKNFCGDNIELYEKLL